MKTEELALASYAPDLTLREFHLIEEICQAQDRGTDDRATAIAASQRITAGTLTTAATQLEKKGYILRRRDEKDRRVVHLLPTEKGRQANRQHSCFHVEMVRDVLDTLTREFIKFIVSKDGQEIVTKDGYYPIPAKVSAEVLKSIE